MRFNIEIVWNILMLIFVYKNRYLTINSLVFLQNWPKLKRVISHIIKCASFYIVFMLSWKIMKKIKIRDYKKLFYSNIHHTGFILVPSLKIGSPNYYYYLDAFKVGITIMFNYLIYLLRSKKCKCFWKRYKTWTRPLLIVIKNSILAPTILL